jgi:hypothetical protein
MKLEVFSQILFGMWNGSWWKNWFFISEYLRKMKIRVIYSITKKRQAMQFVGYHLIYKLICKKGLWLLISSHHNKHTKYAGNICVQTEFSHLLEIISSLSNKNWDKIFKLILEKKTKLYDFCNLYLLTDQKYFLVDQKWISILW